MTAQREAKCKADVDDHSDLLGLARPVPSGHEDLDRCGPAADHDSGDEVHRCRRSADPMVARSTDPDGR